MSDRPHLLATLDHTGVPLLVARLVLGVIFIWMGLSKTGLIYPILNNVGLGETRTVQSLVEHGRISEPIEFLKLIREYKIIPDNLSLLLNITAGVLPWFEVLCAILLVLGIAVRGTGLIFATMLTGFTVMVALRAISIYNAGGMAFCDIQFDCGCGAGVVYICHKLPENAILLLLSFVVIFSRSRRFCIWGDLFTKTANPEKQITE